MRIHYILVIENLHNITEVVAQTKPMWPPQRVRKSVKFLYNINKCSNRMEYNKNEIPLN